MTQLLRNSGLAALACAAALLAPSAFAQQPYPAPGTTLSARDQSCRGLEAQLANLDRGGGDAGRAEQIRRTEDMLSRQQTELDRQSQQSRRQGCDATGFMQLFNPAARSEQCVALNNQIQQMRGNIARLQGDLQQMQSSGAAYERDGQRRSLIQALAQNNCGPQYQSQAALARNPLDNLFGGNSEPQNGAPAEGGSFNPGSAYRTVCVRLCDGYFFPISFSTSQNRFVDDEATCQRMCPAAEVSLFAYPNPGGDINQAISTSGQSYTALPNAFKYKTEWSKTCVCKQANESWANAVKDDPSIPGTSSGQNDIIVTEEKAKQLSAPRDAKGRPILPPSQKGAQKAGPKGAPAAAPIEPAPPPPVANQPEGEKKPIRSVGPKFLSE